MKVRTEIYTSHHQRGQGFNNDLIYRLKRFTIANESEVNFKKTIIREKKHSRISEIERGEVVSVVIVNAMGRQCL